MSRVSAVVPAVLRRARRKSSRAHIALLALVLISVFGAGLALRPPAASANVMTTSQTVTFVPNASGSNALILAGSTFDEVSSALSPDQTFEVPLAIPAIGTSEPLVVEATVTSDTRTVSLIAMGSSPFQVGPLADLQVDVMLLARWEHGGDTAPDIVVAIRATDIELRQLFAGWSNIPALAGLTSLSEAVLLLTPTPGFTLDPTTLPPGVNTFLGVGGPLDEDLVISEAVGLLADAQTFIGGTEAQLQFAIHDDAGATTATVSIEGSFPINDIVTLLSEEFPAASSGNQLNFPSASLEQIEFSFDDSEEETVLGFLGVLTGLDVLGATNLRAQLLIGLDESATGTVFLGALRIDDEGCLDGNCIDLDQLFESSNVSFDLDLKLPALHFSVMVPDDGAFNTSRLGSKSSAFLAAVNGGPAPESYEIPGNVNFSADVPLTPLSPLFAQLHLTTAATVHLQGTAGFDLTFLDGAAGTLNNFAAEATVANLGAVAPAGWPNWLVLPNTGEWKLFMRFAAGGAGDDDDALEIGASVEHVTSTLFPGADLTLAATFTGQVSGTQDWTITASASLSDDWEQPLGISFLTVNNASAVLTIHQPPGGPIEAGAELCGTVTVGSDPAVIVGVCARIDALDPVLGPTGQLELTLVTPVSLQDLVDFLPDGILPPDVELPAPIGATTVGPGTITFMANGGGAFSIGATVTATFVPASTAIPLELLLLVDFPAAGEPTAAIGLKLGPTASLGALLGQDLGPLDLPFTPTNPLTEQLDPTMGGFGFVFTSADIDIGSGNLAPNIDGWFRPLFGGDLEGRQLTNRIGILGSIRPPEPLAGLLSGIGADPDVLISGGINLDREDFSANLNLEMSLREEALPEFIDNITLGIGVSISAANPSLAFYLDGTMDLRFKQGLDHSVAQPLIEHGIRVPIAEEVLFGDECERGGFNMPEARGTSAPRFCYDKIRITVGAELSVEPTRLGLKLFGDITSLNALLNGGSFSPLGIEEIQLIQVGAELEINYVPPTTFEFKVGILGNMTLLGNPMAGAVKLGASVTLAPPPIFVTTVMPLFDGFRFALPEGVGKTQLIDLYNVFGKGSTGAVLEESLLENLPNVALRNLVVSFSPFPPEGVKSLCIPFGFVFRADLYIDPDPDLPSPSLPVCNRETGDFPFPAPTELCVDRKAEGCVAGVNIELSLSGITVDVSLGGFELPAVDMSFDDTILVLRLTLQDQFIRISGGVDIGDGAALGRMALEIKPLTVVFAGQVSAFGFNALVSGSLNANPLDLLAPAPNAPPLGLTLHVVLAAPELALPEYGSTFPDFSENVKADLQTTIDDVVGVLAFIQETVDDFKEHPFTTLGDLPNRLATEGYPAITPAWVDEILTQIGVVDDLLVDDDRESGGYSFFDLLNGFNLGGVNGTRVWCDGFIDKDGNCWGIVNDPPVCIVIEIDGHCWAIPPFHWDGFCGLPALAPIRDADGNCTKDSAAAELRVVFGELVTTVEAFSDIGDANAVIEAVNAWINAGEGFTVFGLQCASLEVAIVALGDSQFDISLEGTLLNNDFEFRFADWRFNDPLASAGALFAQILQGAAGTGCQGADAALFGPDGLGNSGALEPEEEELPPLTVNVSVSPAVLDEGSSVSGNVTLNRAVDASDGEVNVTVDWGDGSVETVSFAKFDSVKAISHKYIDDNPRGVPDAMTITATLTDPHHASDSTIVTVRNVAPSNIELVLSSSILDENDTASLTVTWTDPGKADTHSVRVNWGDGSPVETFPGARSGDRFTHRYLDDSPSGTPGDTPTIAVRVRDDDLGSAFATTQLNVNNVAPLAASIDVSPSEVNEGDEQEFTISWDDPGSLDTYTVYIDWNNDGEEDDAIPTGVTRQATVDHKFLDDDPTGTPFDLAPVRVRVVDDDTGETLSAGLVIRVNNVAPKVCVVVSPDVLDPVIGTSCTGASLTIDEGGVVDLRGVYQDPGTPDLHTVTINWGFAGFLDTTFSFVPDPAQPAIDGHAFSASRAYGDNGVYTITVTVHDDDVLLGTSTATITVINVNPGIAVDETAAAAAGSDGTVLADGPDDDGNLDEPTFVVRQGESMTFTANVSDPGSDDLEFTWDWDAGSLDTSTTATTSLVNPPINDPTPSPALQPRSLFTTASHAWSQACLYKVGLLVEDDDGGTASDDTWVVVTGKATKIEAPGNWFNQYETSKSNKNSINTVTLDCYLKIVRHMSRIFNARVTVDTFTEARAVLNQRPLGDDKEIMVRQILAAWLNFANGSIGWFTMVDTNGDRVADKQFGQLMLESEAMRLDPLATRAQLLAQEQVLKTVNGD